MPPRVDPALLKLVVITDGRGDLSRLEQVLTAAVAGGARCVQLREPNWSARHYLEACERLLPLLDGVRGLLLVNDRLDVAAAQLCHGAQIGRRSLPPEMARDVVGPRSVLGYSAHDLGELDTATGGCDFALLSPVWPTQSKPGLPHLGVGRAGQMTGVARLPVVWLGGVDAARALEVARVLPPRRPAGVAVRSAVLSAEDPEAAARAVLAALDGLAEPA